MLSGSRYNIARCFLDYVSLLFQLESMSREKLTQMTTILGMNRTIVLRSSVAYLFVSAAMLSASYVSSQRPERPNEPITARASEPFYPILTVNLEEEATQHAFLQSVGSYMDAHHVAHSIQCGMESCDVAVQASMPGDVGRLLADVNALVAELRL